MKKPKLDTGAEGGDAPDAGTAQTDDAEEELPEEDMEDLAAPAMYVDAPAHEAPTSGVSASAEPKEPKIRFKKGKTAEGASAHFKENPYTFIAPDDPIVKACVCVLRLVPFPTGAELTRCPLPVARTLTSQPTSPPGTCSCATRPVTQSARSTW